LHDRHGLPLKAIAILPGTRHDYTCRQIGDIRLLPSQAGHAIQPAPGKLATLEDLYRHAAGHGIPLPAQITTAC
jgi:hypothetical protein